MFFCSFPPLIGDRAPTSLPSAAREGNRASGEPLAADSGKAVVASGAGGETDRGQSHGWRNSHSGVRPEIGAFGYTESCQRGDTTVDRWLSVGRWLS